MKRGFENGFNESNVEMVTMSGLRESQIIKVPAGYEGKKLSRLLQMV